MFKISTKKIIFKLSLPFDCTSRSNKVAHPNHVLLSFHKFFSSSRWMLSIISPGNDVRISSLDPRVIQTYSRIKSGGKSTMGWRSLLSFPTFWSMALVIYRSLFSDDSSSTGSNSNGKSPVPSTPEILAQLSAADKAGITNVFKQFFKWVFCPFLLSPIVPSYELTNDHPIEPHGFCVPSSLLLISNPPSARYWDALEVFNLIARGADFMHVKFYAPKGSFVICLFHKLIC